MWQVAPSKQVDYLLILMILPGLTWAGNGTDGQIRRWLNEISQSSIRYSYEGTFVYQCRSQLVSMKIIHAVKDGDAREKLLALNGSDREIVQDPNRAMSMAHANSPRIVRSRQVGSALAGTNAGIDVEQLDHHYQLIAEGDDRIANRPTRKVQLRPRDGYRYGFNIWLDQETGLVLRSDMVNAGGRIIEQIMFTSLTLLDEEQVDAVMEDLAPVPAEQDAMPEDMGTAMSRAMPPEWKIESLPAGFTLAEHFVRPQGEAPAHEQMVFTDGLASVSVFIEKQTAGENPFVGSARMGAVHAFGNVVDGHQVTVIGDVPRDTVKLIGQSIKYQK